MTSSGTFPSELIGLTPRESCTGSVSFMSGPLVLPARATSRILVGRLSRLVVLRFGSESRRAAPPRKPRFLSLGLSLSLTDLPRENRCLIHPLTLDVGDIGDSLDFRLSLSVFVVSVSMVAGRGLSVEGAS